MDFTIRFLALLLLAPLFTQCAHSSKSAPSSGAVTGPFDSRGNYVEDWADSPEKWYRPPAPGAQPNSSRVASTESKPPARSEVSTPQRTTTPAIVKVEPKPTPKPQPKPQAKPKPKPSFTYHKVRRGDTLSSLSRRYGASVTSIKQANGISGTIIRLGETLKIPK